jgi:hypothetical protein
VVLDVIGHGSIVPLLPPGGASVVERAKRPPGR